jgi:hypothetical protein
MTALRMVVLYGVTLAALASAASCGGGSGREPSVATGGTTTSAQTTVNLVVTDTPATDITVLSFQIQITGAVLQPGNVSILPKPVTVDLAQLISDTGMLASTVVGSATYTSLQLTYANPQVTILNNTGATLSLRGQTCSPGASCTFVPALNNATITISSGVFPLTLTASSSTGLNLDLSIPDLLQSDLSVTFANGTSVNLSVLGSGPVRIDDVMGTVTSVSGSRVNITTAFGDQLVLDESSTSAYKFPASICASSAASCLASGQIVAVDASLGGDGKLVIDSLSYLGDSGSSFIKALVLSGAAGTSPTAQLLLRQGINTTSLSAGEIANVAFPTSASYSVATAAYPQVANSSFAGPQDLLPGQELIVSVGSDLVTGSTPSFTSSTNYLQSSQVIGDVSTVDAASSSLSIDTLTGLFTSGSAHIQAIDVQADSNTTLVGFTSIGTISAGKIIAAKGPLLNVPGSTVPGIAAVQIRAKG